MLTIILTYSGYQLLYISNCFRYNSRSNWFRSKKIVLHSLKTIQTFMVYKIMYEIN